MVRRHLHPSPNGQSLLSFFLFTLCLLSSFVSLQPHLCFKPDLDGQNFIQASGKPEFITTTCPLMKRATYSSREKGSTLGSLGLGFPLAFVIMTRPRGGNEATQESRQKHLYHLTHIPRRPPPSPGVPDLVPRCSPGRAGRRAGKEKAKRLQMGAEQERTSRGFSKISIPYPTRFTKMKRK